VRATCSLESTQLLENPATGDQVKAELLGDLIARVGLGVLVVAADRRIVYANKTADALMQARYKLYCKDGCLNSTDFVSSRKLQTLIADAATNGNEPRREGSLILPAEDGSPPFVIHVVPLALHGDFCSSNEKALVGLIVIDGRQGVRDRLRAFVNLFSLTFGESRVVAQLVSGQGLKTAACRLNLAPSTVRTHLTRIMEKTGTHRQAELIKVFYEVTLPQ